MKLGIVGKGGVGKTTLSSLICQAYVAQGNRVLAVDTDSNPNLAMSLGLDEETADTAPVVPRALVVGGGDGAMSPQRLIADYGLETPFGVTLLHAMRVDQAGAGCTCTSHVTVRSLLGAAIEDEADITLVDMEAGLEHLSRSGGTLAYADVALIIMEPTVKSVVTAARTVPLARELGIPRVYGVGNKARLPRDAEFYVEAAAEHGVPLAGIVPFDPAVGEADRRGGPLATGQGDAVRQAVDQIIEFVNSPDEERVALMRERERIEARIAELTAQA